MTAPLRDPIARQALLEVVALGLACGPLGTWVLLLGQAYATESLSHALLPGLVVAALAGAPILLGGLAGVLVAAAAIALAARAPGLDTDTGVGVAVPALVGLGALLALSPDTPAGLQDLLFGDLLGASSGEVVASAGLALAVLAALAAGHRPLALAAFDPSSARALGARPERAGAGLLLLVAITVVAAVQALGSLLVLALVVAPAAAARLLARRLGTALVLSAALAAAAGVAGIYVSYHLDTAAGASVALAALALCALAALAPRAPAAPAGRGLSRSPVEALGDR